MPLLLQLIATVVKQRQKLQHRVVEQYFVPTPIHLEVPNDV